MSSLNKTDDYCIIPPQIFYDERVSLNARGVYALLCSFPKGERTYANLRENCPDTDRVLRRAINELVKYGYLDEGEV